VKIEKLTIKGTGEWNEDALVVAESTGLYGVLDGATSLKPFRGPNGETGGYMASRLVQRELESLTPDDLTKLSLHEAVLRANERLRETMVSYGIDVNRKEELWTTGIALVRIHPNNIEYVQAGDCMIVAMYKDDKIRIVTFDHVDRFDQGTRRLLKEGIANGITSIQQLRKLVEPNILSNKKWINAFDGYSVLSGEPELSEFMEYGRISRSQLKALLIVSDGLFLPSGYRLPNGEAASGMEALVRMVSEKSLGGYAQWLLELEQSDPECLRFPRFKPSDDKTGIWMIFEE
jgi:hypothetical protein